MADLETRVDTLEREFETFKVRLIAMDADLQPLPELIKLEHKFTNTRIDRLARDVDDLKTDVADLKTGVADLKETVGKLPRAVAEIVHEIIDEKRSKAGT